MERWANVHTNAEPVGCRFRQNIDWNKAALVFFKAFAGGLGVACLMLSALYLAANSCLTLVVMASASTL